MSGLVWLPAATSPRGGRSAGRLLLTALVRTCGAGLARTSGAGAGWARLMPAPASRAVSEPRHSLFIVNSSSLVFRGALCHRRGQPAHVSARARGYDGFVVSRNDNSLRV